jgi:hypothetical protein
MMILEARFKVAISRKEYEESANPHKYTDMPGLRWKIYAFNDKKSMATGIYLFDDEGAMKAHIENLRQREKVVDYASDLEMMVWDVQEALCKVTGAPI